MDARWNLQPPTPTPTWAQNLELARLRATTTAAGTRAFFELEPEANDVFARLEQGDGSFRRYRVLPYFSVSADGRVRAATSRRWRGQKLPACSGDGDGVGGTQTADCKLTAIPPRGPMSTLTSHSTAAMPRPQSIAFPLQKTVDEVRWAGLLYTVLRVARGAWRFCGTAGCRMHRMLTPPREEWAAASGAPVTSLCTRGGVALPHLPFRSRTDAPACLPCSLFSSIPPPTLWRGCWAVPAAVQSRRRALARGRQPPC